MRNLLLLSFLAALAARGLGQVPEDSGDGGAPVAPRAQPAEAQDTESARERLLKAADQLDLIQSNAESARVAMESMKSDIAQLQAAHADLKQQMNALQASFDKAEADRVKERQALVDEIAQLVATKTGAMHADSRRREVASDDTSSAPDPGSDGTEIHHHKASPGRTAESEPAPAPKVRKGYYHVVESGETLTMICAAYRADGIKVTLAEVRKANGLSSKASLKVGQKIFIPQPGT